MATEAVFKTINEECKNTVEALKSGLGRIRAGKASTNLLEGIRVMAYGAATPLNQVANVSVTDARSIVINPWDKSVIPEIEKAILTSDLGLTPQNDGKIVRLNIPPLSEERRKELVKIAEKTGEEAKISVRQHRKVANEEIKNLEKGKKISEDDSKRDQEKVQKLVDDTVKSVDDLVDKKTKEIMTI